MSQARVKPGLPQLDRPPGGHCCHLPPWLHCHHPSGGFGQLSSWSPPPALAREPGHRASGSAQLDRSHPHPGGLLTQGCLQVDRTEVVRSSLHPAFSKVFTLDDYFEEVQKLCFEVYNTHGPSSLSCQDDDFWGAWSAPRGRWVGGRVETGRWALGSQGRSRGEAVALTARRWQSLDPTACQAHPLLLLQGLFSKPDPLLELHRINDDQSKQLVYRTDVVKNGPSPTWQPCKVSLSSLCRCEEPRPLKGLVWDYDSRGKHDVIAEFSTTFVEMQNAFREDQWDCVNLKYTQEKRSSKNSRVVILADLKVREGFLGYFALWPLQVAVDFIASTGDPGTAASLPYINPFQPHGVLQALAAVGETCQDYDSDKRLSALGFGARIPPKCEVGEPGSQDPWLLPLLLGTSYHVTGSGQVAGTACWPEGSLWPQQHYILLILTNGVATNMADAREAIMRASHLPVSIIVGMGNADFTDMQVLDGDSGVLCSPRGEPIVSAGRVVGRVPRAAHWGPGPLAVLSSFRLLETFAIEKCHMDAPEGRAPLRQLPAPFVAWKELPVPWTHTHSFTGDLGLPSCLSHFALCPE
uniref:C2 domain-containing protein n=1 Tax=Phocoena sinus TaxID=42100 RepID=A0A8C9BJX2_PHOSS